MSEIELKALAAKLESNALAYEMLGEKQLPALLREAAAALAPQWQGISTAPKDGRKFLCLRTDGTMSVCWYERRTCLENDVSTFVNEGAITNYAEVTKWQPLPAPPEVEG